MSWIVLALISAFVAGVSAVVAKIGLKNVDSSAGFAVQSVVILIATWTYVLISGKASELSRAETRDWLFLGLTGLVTTLAYLFYFAAIKAGDVSRAAPVDRLSLVFAILLAALFLGEKITTPVIIGGALMALGAVVIAVFGGSSGS